MFNLHDAGRSGAPSRNASAHDVCSRLCRDHHWTKAGRSAVQELKKRWRRGRNTDMLPKKGNMDIGFFLDFFLTSFNSTSNPIRLVTTGCVVQTNLYPFPRAGLKSCLINAAVHPPAAPACCSVARASQSRARCQNSFRVWHLSCCCEAHLCIET